MGVSDSKDSDSVDEEIAYWLSLSDEELDDLSETMEEGFELVAPAAAVEWQIVNATGFAAEGPAEVTLTPHTAKLDVFTVDGNDRYLVTR
jgi:hypothetical protein